MVENDRNERLELLFLNRKDLDLCDLHFPRPLRVIPGRPRRVRKARPVSPPRHQRQGTARSSRRHPSLRRAEKLRLPGESRSYTRVGINPRHYILAEPPESTRDRFRGIGPLAALHAGRPPPHGGPMVQSAERECQIGGSAGGASERSGSPHSVSLVAGGGASTRRLQVEVLPQHLPPAHLHPPLAVGEDRPVLAPHPPDLGRAPLGEGPAQHLPVLAEVAVPVPVRLVVEVERPPSRLRRGRARGRLGGHPAEEQPRAATAAGRAPAWPRRRRSAPRTCSRCGCGG